MLEISFFARYEPSQAKLFCQELEPKPSRAELRLGHNTSDLIISAPFLLKNKNYHYRDSTFSCFQTKLQTLVLKISVVKLERAVINFSALGKLVNLRTRLNYTCTLVSQQLWNFIVRQVKFNGFAYPNEQPQRIL